MSKKIVRKYARKISFPDRAIKSCGQRTFTAEKYDKTVSKDEI